MMTWIKELFRYIKYYRHDEFVSTSWIKEHIYSKGKNRNA